MIILLLAFGSVVAMSLPIGTALFGLGVGLSVITLVAATTDIGTAAPTLATMIGLGVGIDYSLFILTRHRQNLATGMDVQESIGRAIGTAGQAVLFAGTTVVIAISGLAVAGIPYVTKLGFMSAIVVAVMMTAALTLLPALLGLAGRHVDSLKVPHLRRRKRAEADADADAGARDAGRRGRRCGLAALGHVHVPAPLGRGHRAAWRSSSRSPRRSCRCGSASPTTGPIRRARPSARRSTSSPGASGPAPTARSCSPWPCRRRTTPAPPTRSRPRWRSCPG